MNVGRFAAALPISLSGAARSVAVAVAVAPLKAHLPSVGEVQSVLESNAGHPLQSHLVGLALHHAQAEHGLQTHEQNTGLRSQRKRQKKGYSAISIASNLISFTFPSLNVLSLCRILLSPMFKHQQTEKSV